VLGKCPECKSKKVHRVFGLGCFDIAIGKCGRAANSYETSFVNHPSELGKYKGTKFKSGKK
jgi:hypothetical protein